MPALVDTNVLVYRFDPRFDEKQEQARRLLETAASPGVLSVPHQALVEFVAATTRPIPRVGSLLTSDEAREEVESMLLTFDVLYPDAALLRTALRGTAAYGPGSTLTCGPMPNTMAVTCSTPRTSNTAGSTARFAW